MGLPFKSTTRVLNAKTNNDTYVSPASGLALFGAILFFFEGFGAETLCCAWSFGCCSDEVMSDFIGVG